MTKPIRYKPGPEYDALVLALSKARAAVARAHSAERNAIKRLMDLRPQLERAESHLRFFEDGMRKEAERKAKARSKSGHDPKHPSQ